MVLRMNVIVFASRKGGSGKSTLTSHLAAHASERVKSCLLVDADPQGSLSLWHQLRGGGRPALLRATRGIADVVAEARHDGYDWMFIDTPPNVSTAVIDAIRAATLVVIPARLTVFDLAAVRETIALSRKARTPYAVVINAAPPKVDDTESPFVTEAREVLAGLKVPVWPGQLTNLTTYSLSLACGEGATEYDPESQAAAEISRLWAAIDRSVKAIHGVYSGTAMHRTAA